MADLRARVFSTKMCFFMTDEYKLDQFELFLTANIYIEEKRGDNISYLFNFMTKLKDKHHVMMFKGENCELSS